MNIIEYLTQTLLESQLEQAIIKTATSELAEMIYDYAGLQSQLLLDFWEQHQDEFPNDVDPYSLEEVIEEYPELEHQFEAELTALVEVLVMDAYSDVLYHSDFDNDNIRLYREITAPINWVESSGLTSRSLGEYWSYTEDAANAHWGNYNEDHVEWLLVGLASKNDIDWVSTLVQNANPDMEEEKEIRIKNGAAIILERLSYTKSGQTFEVNIPTNTQVKA